MRIILEATRDELLGLAQRLDGGTRIVLHVEPETPVGLEEPLSPLAEELCTRGLRPRLAQMVELDYAGYTRAQIATRLVLSRKSVATYWREIYSVLDVHSREELRALVRGLVAPS